VTVKVKKLVVQGRLVWLSCCVVPSPPVVSVQGRRQMVESHRALLLTPAGFRHGVIIGIGTVLISLEPSADILVGYDNLYIEGGLKHHQLQLNTWAWLLDNLVLQLPLDTQCNTQWQRRLAGTHGPEIGSQFIIN